MGTVTSAASAGERGHRARALPRVAALAMAALLAPARSPEAAPAGSGAPAAAVTREDVEATLRALEEAYGREDLRRVLDLHDEALRPRVEQILSRLFASRNYFHLRHRVVRSQSRPEGGLDVEVVTELRSRPTDERHDRQEKTRWLFAFSRAPAGAVVISRSEAAPVQAFSPSQTWDPVRFEGRVRVVPSPSAGGGGGGGSLEVSLSARVRARDPSGSTEIGFALHPFARAATVSVGGEEVAAQRLEGALDAWLVPLREAVPPGTEVELDLAYRIDLVGRGGKAWVAPDQAAAFTASAWHPVFRPASIVDPVAATHRLEVEVPADLDVVVPGLRVDELTLEDGRRRATFESDVPGGELCLVAGRWERAETPLVPLPEAGAPRRPARGSASRSGARPVIVTWGSERAGARDEPRRDAGAVAASALLDMEATFGPYPARELTVVGLEGADFASAPGLIVVPSLHLRPEPASPRENRSTFFIAHSVAHGWLVDGLRLEGDGAGAVVEGICDFLATDWSGRVLDATLPPKWRDHLIAPASLVTSSDQPLLSPQGSPFGAAKVEVVLAMHRQLVGAETQRRMLREWWDGTRAGSDPAPAAPVAALMGVLAGGGEEAGGPGGDGAQVRRAFVERWFYGQGFAEPGVPDVVLRPLTPEEAAAAGLDPDAWQRAEIHVVNRGVGPAPVRVVIAVDLHEQVRDIVLASEEERVLALDVASLPTSVRLDPDRVVWQGRVDDDEWPARDPKRRDELGRVRADVDQRLGGRTRIDDRPR